MIPLIKAAQLLLSLSILVFLHELGHYLASRAFKTRVEKFYLFLNPGFTLYKKQIGETEWGIGWLPLGGYVKIAGMVDESFDKEQMKQPPQPWEFRSKPAWQRLIIMLGGIIVNLFLGFAIYSGVLIAWGETVLPADKIPYGLAVNDQIEPWGFQDGDMITTINGEATVSFEQIRRTMFFDPVYDVTVSRDGQSVDLHFDQELGQAFVDSAVRRPFGLRMPCLVDSTFAGMPAAAMGLRHGDRVQSVNQAPTAFHDEVVTELHRNAGSTVVLTVERGGELVELTGEVSEKGALGFAPMTAANLPEFAFEDRSYTLLNAWGPGFRLASNTLQEYVLSMRFLFSKSGAKQVGSLVTFGSIFAANWDWEIFWRNTAFFSLILAFMNLLPIPALDGGHVVFLLYEMVVGKPAPEKILEGAQMIGVVFLIGLMVYALGNDVWRVVTGQFG